VPFRAQKGEELELVRQAFPSLAVHFDLCHTCSCHEILRAETPGQVVRFSHDSVVVQVMLERLAPPAGAKDDGAKARAEAGGGSA
jgi:hypothetical protein